MRKTWIVLIIGIFLYTPLMAQEEENNRGEDKNQEEKQDSTFADKLRYGGYIWASFGSLGTSVEVAPQVSYPVTDRWDGGIGLKYMYFGTGGNTNLIVVGDDNTLQRTSNHIFGGSVFTSYVLIRDMNKILPFEFNGQLVGHLEYEALNAPGTLASSSASRDWIHNYFVGGGLRQKLGKRAYVSVLVLYNLNEKANFIYNNNPLLRIRFGF